MAFFFSAQISIASFCSQEMKLPSFIFNWISNINLLSFTGPFMSPSLPSKLFRGGIKGFACPLHYSSAESNTHNQRDPAKLEWESHERFTFRASWLIFCLARPILIFFSHILLKKKKTIGDDIALMLQTACKTYICTFGLSATAARLTPSCCCWAVIGCVNGGCLQSSDSKR